MERSTFLKLLAAAGLIPEAMRAPTTPPQPGQVLEPMAPAPNLSRSVEMTIANRLVYQVDFLEHTVQQDFHESSDGPWVVMAPARRRSTVTGYVYGEREAADFFDKAFSLLDHGEPVDVSLRHRGLVVEGRGYVTSLEVEHAGHGPAVRFEIRLDDA